jgi:hypothetical protein
LLACVICHIRRCEIPCVRSFVVPRKIEHPQVRPDPQEVGAVGIQLPADR